jgi:hypothetical protein
MSAGIAAWATLFLLGAWHGINPGMGWLFAVARGMQEHRTRAVAWSLPPIALGHALAIGVVVLIAQLAQVAIPMPYVRIGVAVILVGLGLYKLVRSRHFRWGGMQVGFRDLTIWSFLMASAHGAGLMVLPVVLAGPHAHHHMTALQGAAGGAWASHSGVPRCDRDGRAARLSQIWSGNASPVMVQSGPDMGYRIGGNRSRSAISLKTTTATLPL